MSIAVYKSVVKPPVDYEEFDLMGPTLDSRVTYSRTSSGTYFDADGVMRLAAINEPRFDHDPLTKELRGLLVEDQRTNSVLRSGQLHTYTYLMDPIVTANAALAPDGTMSATEFEVSAGQAGFQIRNVGPDCLTPQNNANSVYFKVLAAPAGTEKLGFLRADRLPSYCGVDLITKEPLRTIGAGINYAEVAIEPLADGWYRLRGSYTSDVVMETRIMLSGGAPGTRILLWGAQAEQGFACFPTSYIPTDTVAVTRARETCYITSDHYRWVPSEGTAFAEGICYVKEDAGGSPSFGIIAYGNGGLTNTYNLGRRDTTGRYAYPYLYARTANNTAQELPVMGGYPALQVVRGAISFRNTEVGAALKGQTVRSLSVGLNPAPPTVGHLYPGGASIGGAIFGAVRKARYYPRALTDAEMLELTA